MSWADIWKIILAALASVGGVAGLIVLAIKFASNIIAERLSQKYELRLQKELEAFKSILTKKEYVSKARFDVEFKIYRELSQVFSEAIEGVHGIIPSGEAYTLPIVGSLMRTAIVWYRTPRVTVVSIPIG